MTAKDLGPLDWRMAITDHNGRPTPEFQRRWETQRGNNDLIGVHLGAGPPTLAVTTDGETYADTSTTPFTFYVSANGAWEQTAAIKFTDLLDAPHNYTSAAHKLVSVNAGATGLEFNSISAVLDTLGLTQGDILYRNATGWTVLPPGTAGFLLSTNGTGANPAWVVAPTSLPSIANNTLLANTSGSTAVPVSTTVSTLLDSALGNTQGDILFRSATGWSTLAPGTSGFLLTSGGTGANPTWSAAPLSGITQLTGDVTAGPGSGSQAAILSTTGVSAGSYTNTNLTVDAKGRITAASNGSSTVSLITPNVVQIASSVNSTSVTLPGAPTQGNVLIAAAFGYSSVPTIGSGWSDTGLSTGSNVLAPGDHWFYKIAGSGESATQTPVVAPAGRYGVVLYEVSGIPDFTTAFENSVFVGNSFGGGSVTLNYTTTSAFDLALATFGAETGSADPGAGTISGLSGALTASHAIGGFGAYGSSGTFSTKGTAISVTGSSGGNAAGRLVVLKPTIITGGGTTGALTKWSSSSSITTGNLSGDITTSGSTVTTLASSGVTAGSYTNTNLTVDAKGRITAAANGTGGGGGGSTGTVSYGNYNLISSQTLGAAAGSVSFSSIPQGYSDLIIVTNARGDTAAANTSVNLQFNGDTGANYDREDLELNGGGTVTSGALRASTSMTLGYMAAASAPSGVADVIESHVGNYSGSTFQKAVVSNSTLKNGTAADSNLFVIRSSGWWRSAAAVTSLTLTPGAGNFATGSTFYLYGRGGNAPNITLTNSMTLISHTVTSGSQTSVTVSIPSSYTNLQVSVSGRSQVASNLDEVIGQFNGDTGANYDFFFADQADNTTTIGTLNSYAGSNVYFGQMPGSTATANMQGWANSYIGNYGNTSFFKQVQSFSGYAYSTAAPGQRYTNIVSTWKNTAAINTLVIKTASGAAFTDGAVIDVYGIGGSQTVSVVPVGSGGTGQTSFPIKPQGRLTVTSGTSVPITNTIAQTSIFYTPHEGNLVPIFDGTRWNPTPFSEITYNLSATAHLLGNLYDLFVFNNSGSLALGSSPAWTSTSARSNAISRVSGLWVNTSSITLTLSGGSITTSVAANQATYVGTFYATANGQTGCNFHPSPVSGGANPIMGLYNAYNRVKVVVVNEDSAGSWTYASSTFRPTNNSTNNRVNWVDGLQQSHIDVSYTTTWASGPGDVGVNLDASTGSPTHSLQMNAQGATTGSPFPATLTQHFFPQLGFHFVQSMESSLAGTTTFFGSTNGQANHLQLSYEA